MRKATQDYGFIVENDRFIGVALGYDYCAEHEWGIKDLKRICGIPGACKENMGIVNRSITKAPPFVFKVETYNKKKFAILYTSTNTRQTQEQLEEYFPRDLKHWKKDLLRNEEWYKKHPSSSINKDNIITAWNGGSFGVAVMGDKEVKWLEELKKAIEEKNLSIAITKMLNPFAGSSLCLMITNRIPQETLEAMYHSDKEYFDREDYEEKIGMKEIIEKHGNENGHRGLHYFMACSPKWIDYDNEKSREEQKKKLNTKYDIIYWVNYSDDDENYGWYTVEEIREWLTGKKKLVEIRKGNN